MPMQRGETTGHEKLQISLICKVDGRTDDRGCLHGELWLRFWREIIIHSRSGFWLLGLYIFMPDDEPFKSPPFARSVPVATSPLSQLFRFC